jgi:hypothetical protein
MRDSSQEIQPVSFNFKNIETGFCNTHLKKLNGSLLSPDSLKNARLQQKNKLS